jgi:hypothetical protein
METHQGSYSLILHTQLLSTGEIAPAYERFLENYLQSAEETLARMIEAEISSAVNVPRQWF